MCMVNHKDACHAQGFDHKCQMKLFDDISLG